MNHEGYGDTNGSWYTWNNLQRIGKGTGRLGNKGTSGNHQDQSIFDISQNTEKSLEETRRLAVPQTPVRNSQLTLGWKTLKGVK